MIPQRWNGLRKSEYVIFGQCYAVGSSFCVSTPENEIVALRVKGDPWGFWHLNSLLVWVALARIAKADGAPHPVRPVLGEARCSVRAVQEVRLAVAVKSRPGTPMTLGNAAAARVRLIVWRKACGHQVEPDAADMAERHGTDTLGP